MARSRRESVAGGRLSVEAAHYYARIYSSARAGCLAELRRAGCNEEEAEDIFAATLERIMRKFDPAGSTYVPAQMVALLKKACRQKLIDERRHRAVLRLVPLEDASHRFDGTAGSQVEATEEREAVAMGREAISSLPERDRALFFQRHQLGLSPDEILRRNPGLSQRTYRKVMQRANARALRAFEEIGSGARCAQMRREHLHRYAAGEVGEKELAMVRAHLRHCRACRLGAAQMRDHMHDVAAGLAAVLAVDCAQGGMVVDWVPRLLDAVQQGGHALGEATRAARERVRDLALRAATALPGSGGETAAGQLVGGAGAKAMSACAAGAIAAGCLAAGVVPGVGALELGGQHRHDKTSSAPTSQAQSSPAGTVLAPSLGPSGDRPAKVSATSRVDGDAARDKTAARPMPDARTGSSPRPTISGYQAGTEFGGEAEGAGTPLPSAFTGSSGGESSSSGGETSFSRRTGKSTQGESKATTEFGL